jgi:alpha-tubulin suppressor-like RCC1 family protein
MSRRRVGWVSCLGSLLAGGLVAGCISSSGGPGAPDAAFGNDASENFDSATGDDSTVADSGTPVDTGAAMDSTSRADAASMPEASAMDSGTEAAVDAAPDAAVCGSGDHSPCVVGSALPTDCACAAVVCGSGVGQASCCTATWDLSCVEYANAYCATGTCSGQPIELSEAGLPATNVTITQIAMGQNAGCAVDSTGAVWCFGSDQTGIVNDGTLTAAQQTVYFPRKVRGLPAAAQVALNQSMACIVDTTGALWCWGTFPGTSTPVTPTKWIASGVSKVRLVGDGAYDDGCAVKTDGTVWCWGQLAYQTGNGMLGDNNNAVITTPGQVTALATPQGDAGLVPGAVVDVALSLQNVCALTANGAILCWGNPDIEVGNWTPAAGVHTCIPTVWSASPGFDCNHPVTGASSVSLDSEATCWSSGGQAHCIGYTTSNILGNSSSGNGPTNLAFDAGTVTSVSIGGDGSGFKVGCALLSSGTVSCWGGDAYNSTGTDALPTQSQGNINPTQVLGLSGVTQFVYSPDENQALALTTVGRVYTFGAQQVDVGVGYGPGIGSGQGLLLTEMHFVDTP